MDELKQQKLEILSKCLGEYDLLKEPQVQFFCPFCNHKNKKLEVNLDTTQYHCWVCGRGGGRIEQVLKIYGTKDILEEWYEKVKKQKLDGDYDIRALLNYHQDDVSPVSTVALPPEAKRLLNSIPSLVARHALNFLNKRGVSYDLIRTYDIRFCESGKYQDRIVCPSYDANGRVNFFVARAIFDVDPKKKYLNSKVDRNEIIFNELFVTWARPIILTEGMFDALAVRRNALPLLGSSLSENSMLFRKIMHFKPQVILFLDNDTAGQEATNKIAKLLLEWRTDVWYIPWGDCKFKDPGETPRPMITELLKKKKRITQSELMRKMLE